MAVAKLLLKRGESKRPLTSRRRGPRSPSKLGWSHVTFEVMGRDGALLTTRSERQRRDARLRDFATYALLPRSVELLWRGDLPITGDQVFGAGNHVVRVKPIRRAFRGA